MMNIIVKIRMEATTEAADEIQAHMDATTVTIYTDDSDIEDKIGAATYDIVTNEASHQHLESEAQFNVS